MFTLLIVAAALVGLAVLVFVVVKMMWRVAEPNEALIVSGLGARDDGADPAAPGLGFKIVVALVSLGCLVFLVGQIRALRRQKRNLEHWEKGEPLEGTGDWD